VYFKEVIFLDENKRNSQENKNESRENNEMKSFYDLVQEARAKIRGQLEEETEKICEDERRKCFVEGAMLFAEDISIMTNIQKEKVRTENGRNLEILRNEIFQIWEKMIKRYVKFQMIYAIYEEVIFFLAGAVLLIVLVSEKNVRNVIILGVMTFLMGAVTLLSKSTKVYISTMFMSTGSIHLVKQLFKLYGKYGRSEAAIYLSDYRGISRIDLDHWVYTSSHEIKEEFDLDKEIGKVVESKKSS